MAAPSPWPPSEDDQSLEHLTTALIAIVAGVISFLTIVGNIMVRPRNTTSNFRSFVQTKYMQG